MEICGLELRVWRKPMDDAFIYSVIHMLLIFRLLLSCYFSLTDKRKVHTNTLILCVDGIITNKIVIKYFVHLKRTKYKIAKNIHRAQFFCVCDKCTECDTRWQIGNDERLIVLLLATRYKIVSCTRNDKENCVTNGRIFVRGIFTFAISRCLDRPGHSMPFGKTIFITFPKLTRK